LLEALLRKQPGEPLDKQELAQIGLGRKLTLYDRSLDMHVSNLRKKIGPHPTAAHASSRCAAAVTTTASDRTLSCGSCDRSAQSAFARFVPALQGYVRLGTKRLYPSFTQR
jgi:hypothetical protein